MFDVVGDAAQAPHVQGFRAPAVQAIAGVTYRQLDYWARTGVIEPSVRSATGSGSQRLYSFTDIVIVKLIKRLLDTGISLQSVRKAIDLVRSRDPESLSEITLIGDGATIYELSEDGDIIDILAGGQCVFGIAVKHTVAEVRGSVSEFVAETGRVDESPSPSVNDELAARRKAKTAS
nr:MerR family transcriptional regulator [Gordonia alkaliphila]